MNATVIRFLQRATASALTAVSLGLLADHAQAQQTAKVVTTCGAAGYTAGSTNYVTIDTGGGGCGASGSGGSPTTPSYTGPSNVLSADASATIATGGTYQTVLIASRTRQGCTIQNPLTATEALNVRIGGLTVFNLAPGSTFNCQVGGIVIGDLIAVTAATTGHAYAASSQNE